VEIEFRTRKLQKESQDYSRSVQWLGSMRAKLLRRRLDDLRAAENLETMRALPQTRCHELKGDRAGQLSIDLGHPYRLIFEVADTPIPTKPDGGLDWRCVRSIRILGVEDTHE
jgi:proteic killer suppression protein